MRGCNTVRISRGGRGCRGGRGGKKVAISLPLLLFSPCSPCSPQQITLLTEPYWERLRERTSTFVEKTVFLLPELKLVEKP